MILHSIPEHLQHTFLRREHQGDEPVVRATGRSLYLYRFHDTRHFLRIDPIEVATRFRP
jgi:hypothetical protein